MMKLKTRRPAFYKDDHPHLAAQGKPTAKNMKKEGVSPHRSVQLRRSRWVLGDVTEVLDHNSWKLGKITEVLKNDYFVIRLAGFIQPREFHISCLRIPHAYDSRQLTVAGRVRLCLEFIFLVTIYRVYLFPILLLFLNENSVIGLQTTNLLLPQSEKLRSFYFHMRKGTCLTAVLHDMNMSRFQSFSIF